MKVAVIPGINGVLGTVHRGLLGGLEELEIRGRIETVQTTAYQDRPEYLLEFWRIEETYSHSHPRERPSANAGMKNSNITAIRNNIDNTKINRREITRKQKWDVKQLYRGFKWLTSDISYEKTGTLLRKENFQRETESLLIVAQNNAIRTNHVKARIQQQM